MAGQRRSERTSTASSRRTLKLEDPIAEEERAREYVLRALSASARSRSRLAAGLAQREVEPELAEKILDRFTEVGLIDDGEYASALARTRFNERGLSRRAIAAELRDKGLAQPHIESALEQITSHDEESAARELVRQRLPRIANLDRTVQVRRLAGLLGRKGYSGGTAMRAIREELDLHAESDESQ